MPGYVIFIIHFGDKSNKTWKRKFLRKRFTDCSTKMHKLNVWHKRIIAGFLNISRAICFRSHTTMRREIYTEYRKVWQCLMVKQFEKRKCNEWRSARVIFTANFFINSAYPVLPQEKRIRRFRRNLKNCIPIHVKRYICKIHLLNRFRRIWRVTIRARKDVKLVAEIAAWEYILIGVADQET